MSVAGPGSGPQQRTFMNPGALYFAQFAALASTGRFTSVFLASFNLTDSQVGLIMSITIALSMISLALGGILADKFSKGKLKIIIFSNVLFCAFFQILAFPVASSHRFQFICTIYVLSRFVRAPAAPVLDAYTLEYLESSGRGVNKSQFGKARMWGAVSWGVTSVALGGCLDYIGFQSVYIFNALTTAFLVLLFGGKNRVCGARGFVGFVPLRGDEGEYPCEREDQVNCVEQAGNDNDHRTAQTFEDCGSIAAEGLEKEGSGRKESVLEFCRVLLWNPRSVVFLFTVACSRVGTSLVENLVFLFFVQELKASYLLCGIAVAITVIFEIPLFYASERILRTFGSSSLLLIGMLCYVTRVVVYTLADSHHVRRVLWVEPLHGVTFSLIKLATVMEMSELAPSHLQATGQSFLSVCGTVGTLTGTLGGGYVMQRYGSVVAYRTAAALVTVAAVLYGVTTLHYRGLESFAPRGYKETEAEVRNGGV